MLLKCPGAEGRSSQGRKGGKTLETPDPYPRLSEPLNRLGLGGRVLGAMQLTERKPHSEGAMSGVRESVPRDGRSQ